MKKVFFLAVLALCSLSVNAQPILDRFKDPEKASVVFVEKGNRAFGIKGSFRSFSAIGDASANAGYNILSLVNIGDGKVRVWDVRPNFSFFVADDLALVASLDYSGYLVNTDINLDFRDILSSTDEALNVNISNRHILNHTFGASLAARKYLAFFGSKTIGVFGEGRLYGNYSINTSEPIDLKLNKANRAKDSHGFSVGIKIAAGVALQLKNGNAFTVSVPVFGVAYSTTKQHKETLIIDEETQKAEYKESTTRLSQFNAARNVDLLGIQFGYVHFIKPKKK